jgi:HK97 family phage major capsid protein
MLKALNEKRNEKVAEMQSILDKAKEEKRAMTEEEMEQFNALENEISNLDATIEAEKRASNYTITDDNTENNVNGEEKRAESEERAFANYIKRQCGIHVEERAGEQNLDMTNNGAVIPTTIANRVITKVQELAPILAKSTRFNVKGTLKVPVWGKAGTGADQDITVGYQTEFMDITANSGKFTSVDLTGFLAGALTLVGKSVINNAQVDVANFIINEMAKKIAIFLEKELINGADNKATGALATATTMNAGSNNAISADNLIDLQAKIPTAYQNDAVWVMNPKTFTALKKLKDSNGQYLLQSDFAGAMPYRILGRPVYLSENMPEIASEAKAVLYGDLSGLAVNFREDISIQVLQEKYATQHAVGIVSWFEFDSDVIDHQKLATLVMSNK